MAPGFVSAHPMLPPDGAQVPTSGASVNQASPPGTSQTIPVPHVVPTAASSAQNVQSPGSQVTPTPSTGASATSGAFGTPNHNTASSPVGASGATVARQVTPSTGDVTVTKEHNRQMALLIKELDETRALNKKVANLSPSFCFFEVTCLRSGVGIL